MSDFDIRWKQYLKSGIRREQNELAKLFYQAGYQDAVVPIRASVKQSQRNDEYQYACDLANALHRTFYLKETPELELVDSTMGVLGQIDNMISGIIDRFEKTRQAQRETCAEVLRNSDCDIINDIHGNEMFRAIKLDHAIQACLGAKGE